MKCEKCGEDAPLPFKCQYCGAQFCAIHRLPEAHDCPDKWRATPPAPAREEKTDVKVRTVPRIQYVPIQRVPIARPKRSVLYFGPEEPLHFLVGMMLVVAVGMSIFTSGWGGLSDPLTTVGLLIVFALAFALHELAHKFVAQLHGLWAEFRTNLSFVLITLLSLFLPLKIIAPGAVMISGPVTIEIGGKTALAGPLTSIVMGLILYALVLVLPMPGWLALVFLLGAEINAFLAFFNLLPFFVFDGQKILAWDKLAWGSSFLASLFLMTPIMLPGVIDSSLIAVGVLLLLPSLCAVLAVYRAFTARGPRRPEFAIF